MALNAYITEVQQLLHDPNQQFYSTATLSIFINEARAQLAVEGECVRTIVDPALASGTNAYPMSLITDPTLAGSGLGTCEAIRSIASGSLVLEARNWDYFNFYFLGIAKPANGPPRIWCNFSPGPSGTFFVSPTPDQAYSIRVEGIFNVVPLADDTTAEAIPYPWTDAVQYYAAYLAYLDSQRYQDANDMKQLYEEFMERARAGVSPLGTPYVNPGAYPSRSQRGKPQPSRVSIGDQTPQGQGRS